MHGHDATRGQRGQAAASLSQVSCREAIALIVDHLKLLPTDIWPWPEAAAQALLVEANQKGDVPIIFDAAGEWQLAELIECAGNTYERGYLLSEKLIAHGRVNRAKLMRWLKQKAPPKARAVRKRQPPRKVRRLRYADEKPALEEFRRLTKGGKMTKSEAARELAKKPGRGSFEQRVARFRKFR